MASDYEKIKADNIRTYGEGKHHLELLQLLYTDRTHFIFELLQNAEDKNASRVLFRLFPDRLEVLHDGDPFDCCDVRGICGVAKGTKQNDLTKIGKFGIGFKAVYAYTSVPEVHSGDEHFRIEHYVRPTAAPARNPGDAWTTLFVFGFDLPSVPAEAASREIATRLRGLTGRTLLFLRKIEEIQYILPDAAGGNYLREQTSQAQGRRVTVIGETAGNEESESWLVFEKRVPIPSSTESVAVEIGFKLEPDPTHKTESISSVRKSPLYVFFPTEKQTNFGFLIQGPYRTTPARDNIPREDDWNAKLVSATVDLIVEALYDIKARGLLTVAALDALPIRLDIFPEDGMFFPIVAAVRDALRTGDLLPTEDGTYVTAANAKLARPAELRKLLGQEQLFALFPPSRETRWLSGEITEGLTRDLHAYLINVLNVEEVIPDSFAGKISSAFLSPQSDAWFVSFYRFLSGQERLWREPRLGDRGGVLRSKPILRLQDNKLGVPFSPNITAGSDTAPNAYLPPPYGTDLACVKATIAGDKDAATFLKKLGLREPDIFDDIIHNVLPKYASRNTSVSSDQHTAHIHKIFRALTLDSEIGKKKLIEAARKSSFLNAFNCAGQTAYKRPCETYCSSDDLRLYFKDFPGVWFVDEPLPDGPAGDAICNSLGVELRPRRLMFPEGLPPEIQRNSTRHETVINYKLDGFDRFVETLKAEDDFETRKRRALVLWKYLADHLRSDPQFFFGQYTWFYRMQRSRSFDSFMLTQLSKAEWIPSLDQSLKKPLALAMDELCDEFREAHDLIRCLGVRTEDLSGTGRQLLRAAELGVSLDDIEFIKRNREAFLQWKCVAEHAAKPAFPVKPLTDAARREARISEQWQEATEKEYAHRERSVRTSRSAIEPRVRLIQYYTNDDRQMVCQICGGEMPFKKRNGEYYFEEVELLGREQFTREHEAQYLALCPTCAAKYREFVKSDKDALDAVEQSILTADGTEIPLILAGLQERLKFVEVHISDIRSILIASGFRVGVEVPSVAGE